MFPSMTTKRAFILTFAPTVPALEVVQAGASKGLTFSTGYVYVTRSSHKINKQAKKPLGARHVKALEKAVDAALTKARKEIRAHLKRFM